MSLADRLEGLPPELQRLRRREWNRNALEDYFPRIPDTARERVLDILIDKGITYELSKSKRYNMKRLTSVVVAHVRHNYSDYDRLLKEEHLERYAARHASAEKVWVTLRDWCPWDASNEVLERCFKATLLRPEERDASWDPMDIDEDTDEEYDAMDLD